MRPFEYARPDTEREAVQFYNESPGAALLAGGTDLINLMKLDVLHPPRVVDLKNVESMRGVSLEDDGLLIGALTTLDELSQDPLAAEHGSLHHVIDGVRSIQIQSMGTIAGDLCHLPNCWYYRNGYGLLGMQNGESLVAAGENRYHAVLGNHGPAKFVSASRFAPSLIAWGARVRVIGPQPDQEEWISLQDFYRTPVSDRHHITRLKPGQIVSHVWIPVAGRVQSAAYEVLQTEGLDWPLAAAAVCLTLERDIVSTARIVLGHVAPTPWVATAAAQALVGQPVNAATAQRIGELALAQATPLSQNAYKVQIASTAVKRALLRATNQLEGGL